MLLDPEPERVEGDPWEQGGSVKPVLWQFVQKHCQAALEDNVRQEHLMQSELPSHFDDMKIRTSHWTSQCGSW